MRHKFLVLTVTESHRKKTKKNTRAVLQCTAFSDTQNTQSYNKITNRTL